MQMNTRFTIEVEALPDRPDAVRVPTEQRLKRWLKIGLRGYRLRVINIERASVAENASNGHHKPTGAK